MDRSLELAIHEHLAEYIAGKSQLDELKSWLIGATWGLDRTQPVPGIELANKLKLALAEHSGGYSTDEELSETLEGLLSESLALL
jgi:hypothetical protein